MKNNELRELDSQKLTDELIELRREQFNLRLQRVTGQLSQTHRLRQVRKNIARAKTILEEKVSEKS